MLILIFWGKTVKERYEVHHGVRIADSAIVAAAVNSYRYISDRFLPDKVLKHTLFGNNVFKPLLHQNRPSIWWTRQPVD